MYPYSRDEHDREVTATRGFTRAYLVAALTAAAIGLGIGIMWVIAGLLYFHPFR